MNRRSFLNRLFLFTGAMSSGLWLPKPEPYSLVPYWVQTQCIRRYFHQDYLEAAYNNGKQLNMDELFRLFYALKRARDARGLQGDIVVVPRAEVLPFNIVESQMFGHAIV